MTRPPRLKSIAPRVQELPSRIRPLTWRTGRTTAERGYGSAWQRARLEHLREHPLCAYCERDGRVTQATVVDHWEPHRGSPALFWDRSNWQSLCAPCHDARKQREEVGRAVRGSE